MATSVAQRKKAAPATGGGLTELKQRLWYVLLAIIVYRVGSHIPIPGIDPERLRSLFDQKDRKSVV